MFFGSFQYVEKMAAISDADSAKEENKEALNLINAAKALNSKKLDLSKRRILNLPNELQSLQQLEVCNYQL